MVKLTTKKCDVEVKSYFVIMWFCLNKIFIGVINNNQINSSGNVHSIAKPKLNLAS